MKMNKLFLGVLGGAVGVAVAGCDLAPTPQQIPTTMKISPGDTMITVGDTTKLALVVYDQNGEEMPGPPSWAPATWWNDGPTGSIEISPQGELVANKGSSVSIKAYLAEMSAASTLRANPSSVKLDVSYYFNQVNQNRDGTVPLLANRQALLRIFVTGDEVSYFRPSVRVDFYLDDKNVHHALMPAGTDELLTVMVESNLVQSYNAVIPSEVIQPGVEMVIQVDPEEVVPKRPGSRARIPEEGRLALEMMTLKNHHQTIVPTIRTADSSHVVHESWSTALDLDTYHIRLLRNFLPIADITVEAHETLYTDADLRTFQGWVDYLAEVRALWQTEGQRGYYYGVVRGGFGSALGGIASAIGSPHASVGLDHPETFVHEVGHSMNLFHAPCGGAGGPDPNYPYDDGGIGAWGYNFADGSLVDPGRPGSAGRIYDVMSYCDPTWISDYQFARAMRYRSQSEGEAQPPGERETTLMLWGYTSDDGVRLRPAFLIESPPTRPSTEGPYRLEGFGPAGELRFGFDFRPDPLAHGEGAYFLFTLPYDPDRDGALERISLSGPGGEDTLSPGSTPPMAILREGPTGPIRAFLRDWDGTVPPGLPDGGPQKIKVLLSDGIPGGAR